MDNAEIAYKIAQLEGQVRQVQEQYEVNPVQAVIQ